VYQDLFTGQRVVAQERTGGAAVRLADVFADFPVAALLSV
jgi:hypothetical protein